jgi:glycosyltransferase involved in cell wall biosynthesis
MLAAWAWLAARTRRPPGVLIIGTDPVLSIAAAIPWRWFHPGVSIVHWCFDLYPEAAFADGLLSPRGLTGRLFRRVAAKAYRYCNSIVELGPCMRQRLATYGLSLRCETLTPWALTEPRQAPGFNQAEREQLFGPASLALLYSGNMGRAHSYDLVLELARHVKDAPIAIRFAARGNRAGELAHAVANADSNVGLAPFAAEEHLQRRLSAADIHIVSLRPGWTGTVVPSKFFGALAVGRPVLFVGSPDSSIANWIREHRVGWVLTESTLAEVAGELVRLTTARQELTALFSRCHAVYRHHFSKTAVLDRWDEHLRSLVRPHGTAQGRLSESFTSSLR